MTLVLNQVDQLIEIQRRFRKKANWKIFQIQISHFHGNRLHQSVAEILVEEIVMRVEVMGDASRLQTIQEEVSEDMGMTN